MSEARESTLEEEIENLIDESLKKRMLTKYRLEQEQMKIMDNRLENCHRRIRMLERALVAQAEVIGSLAHDDMVY